MSARCGIGACEATAILGPSGVGKTTLGLHFVTEGVAAGQRCLYVTFQDTGEQLLQMASGFGWDLELARLSGQLVVRHVPLGELDLDVLTENIRRELAAGTIQRVVIDSHQRDRHVHEFSIGNGGATIGAVLHDVTGVLGWSALRVSGTRPGAGTDAIDRPSST